MEEDRGRDAVGNQTPGKTYGKWEGQHEHREMRDGTQGTCTGKRNPESIWL